MKKISFIITLFACMFASNVMAQHLTVSDVNFAKDTNPTDATLQISISSDQLPAGIDLNVFLPEGFDFKKTSKGKITEKTLVESRGDVLTGDDEEEPNEEHTFTISEIDGGINIVIADFGGGMFEKSTGVLATLNLTCAADAEEKDYEGTVELLKMSDYAGTIAEKETVPFKIIVSEKPYVTGIREISIDAANQKVYTVGGQRVTSKNLKKGIYVVDGKKVTVK
ncbi:MAG: hypothetical protein IKR50_08050 [Prevotella sp.]|nr:hypothetical protein [Prevotella sp.]